MRKAPFVNPFRMDGEVARKIDNVFFSREISGTMTQGFKRFLNARIFKFGRAVSYLFSHVGSRVYGTAMLSFGLMALLLYFIGLYPDKSYSAPIIGAVFSILSVPFLFSEKPLFVLLQDFPITDYILFEFFCIKRVNRMEAESRFPIIAAVLIGVIFSAIGILFPLISVIAVVGIIVFVLVSFVSPEFAFFVTFLLMPYLGYLDNSIVFCLLISLATVSFIRKVIYGKRVIHIEQYEIVLGALVFFVLISGIFVKGTESFTWSVEMLIMTMGYILSSNIITNRRLADRVINSIVIASVPPSVMSIVELVRLIVNRRITTLADVSMSATFADPSVFAVFLITAIVFSAAMIKQNRRWGRVFYIISLSVNLIALLLTCELFAIVALILGVIAYLSFKTNRLAFVIVPLLALLPLALLLLPEGVLNFVFDYIPSMPKLQELFDLWRSCLIAFLDNLFVGIGMGAECFVEEMASYSIHGFTDSANLFIELGLEAGVFALLCFVILLFIRLRHRVSFFIYVRNSEVNILSPISAACIFCLIAYGMVNYIWSDLSAYYLFSAVLGVGSATLRVAKKEYDDRVFYYEDTRASDSSVIDIELR